MYRKDGVAYYNVYLDKIAEELSNKPSKTKFEEKALLSYYKCKMASVFVSIVILFLLTLTIVSMIIKSVNDYTGDYTGDYENVRVGIVEGINVRYVQDTMKYVSLEKLGLVGYDLIDGEKVRLFFDYNDNIVGASLKSDFESRLVLTSSLLVFAIIIVSVIVIRCTLGKPWNEYVKQVKCSKQSCNNCI